MMMMMMMMMMMNTALIHPLVGIEPYHKLYHLSVKSVQNPQLSELEEREEGRAFLANNHPPCPLAKKCLDSAPDPVLYPINIS